MYLYLEFLIVKGGTSTAPSPSTKFPFNVGTQPTTAVKNTMSLAPNPPAFTPLSPNALMGILPPNTKPIIPASKSAVSAKPNVSVTPTVTPPVKQVTPSTPIAKQTIPITPQTPTTTPKPATATPTTPATPTAPAVTPPPVKQITLAPNELMMILNLDGKLTKFRVSDVVTFKMLIGTSILRIYSYE